MRDRSRSHDYGKSYRSRRDSSNYRDHDSRERHRDDHRRVKKSHRSKFEYRNSDNEGNSEKIDHRHREYDSYRYKEEMLNSDKRNIKIYERNSSCGSPKSNHHSLIKKEHIEHEELKVKVEKVKDKEKEKKIKKKSKKGEKEKKKRKRHKSSDECEIKIKKESKHEISSKSKIKGDNENKQIKSEKIRSTDQDLKHISNIDSKKNRIKKEVDSKTNKIKNDYDKKSSKHIHVKEKERRSERDQRRSTPKDKLCRRDRSVSAHRVDYTKIRTINKRRSKESISRSQHSEDKRKSELYDDERLELPLTPTDAQFTGLFTKLIEEPVSDTEIEDILPPVLLDDQMKALLENDPNATQELWDSEDDILNIKHEIFATPKHKNIFDDLSISLKILAQDSNAKTVKTNISNQASLSQFFMINGISEKFAGEELVNNIQKYFNVNMLNPTAALHNYFHLFNFKKSKLFLENSYTGDALSFNKDLLIRNTLCNSIF